MTDVMEGKRYQHSNEERAAIFVKSKFWKECETNNFEGWGSREQWMRDVTIKGTKANVTFHTIVDNEIEKRASKSAEISKPQGTDAGLPLSVFSQAQLEKEEAKAQQQSSASKQSNVSAKKSSVSPSSTSTVSKKQQAKPSTPVDNLGQIFVGPLLQTPSGKTPDTKQLDTSGIDVDLNATLAATELLKFKWVPNDGVVTNKGQKLNFGTATPSDANSNAWHRAYNLLTGAKLPTPLTTEEISNKRLTGVSARDIAYTNKFISKVSEGDFVIPRENRQPLWTDKPAHVKSPTHFRLPLEKIWGQGSIDFSKIPAVDSNYRKAAVVRLKKHSYLGVDKAKPVELLLLRALTARNQTAFECLEKLFQLIAIKTKNEEVIDALKIGRLILADVMEPHYAFLSRVDKLGHADNKVATKKHKDMINDVLKLMWDHPVFPSAHTDDSVSLPPKASMQGKPANISDFERKSRALAPKKIIVAPLHTSPKPSAPTGTKGSGARGRGTRGRGRGAHGRGRGRGNKRKHNFGNPNAKKGSAWYCEVCKRHHGIREKFTCPKKSQ